MIQKIQHVIGRANLNKDNKNKDKWTPSWFNYSFKNVSINRSMKTKNVSMKIKNDQYSI